AWVPLAGGDAEVVVSGDRFVTGAAVTSDAIVFGTSEVDRPAALCRVGHDGGDEKEIWDPSGGRFLAGRELWAGEPVGGVGGGAGWRRAPRSEDPWVGDRPTRDGRRREGARDPRHPRRPFRHVWPRLLRRVPGVRGRRLRRGGLQPAGQRRLRAGCGRVDPG